MKEYYVFLDGIQTGPYSVEQLKKMLSLKRINEDTAIKPAVPGQETQWLTVREIADVLAVPEKGVARFLSFDDQMMRVACPGCGQHYSVPESMFSTKLFECLKCGVSFSLPPCPGEAAASASDAPGMDFSREIPDGDLLCPHCWKSFDQDYILYISVHSELYGDPVLGEYVPSRFVPTTFDPMGRPLDEKGLPATEMACPRCHLRIPAGLLDTPALYFSIAGATSSGKSYFLTCLAHQLRKTLPEYFRTAFFDADPRLNETLNSYEKQLFMSLNPYDITSLPATQLAGEGISDRVRLDGIEIELPKPFVFEYHPEDDQQDSLNMVFYDNSGEMFIPGRDEWSNQATFHLAHSNGIVFLFDPSNDAGMRLNICDVRDPQVSQKPRVVDQTILLNEMISRIRRHANMGSSDVCRIPLVIAVGKYDIWRKSFVADLTEVPYIAKQKNRSGAEEYVLDSDNILKVSYELREMMMQAVPGLVSAAESFFEEVYFVPLSNFGTFAEQKTDGAIGITPAKISPIWVDVPLLLLLARNQQLAAKESRGTSFDRLGTVVKGRIVFTHPHSGKIVRLPLCYAGAEIEIEGKKYTLPAAGRQGL